MSNGLSKNEIDALLHGDQADGAASADGDEGGMMSQEQIEAMLAGMTSMDDDESAPAEGDEGGMMSQEQIEAMLAGMSEADIAPPEAPAAEMAGGAPQTASMAAVAAIDPPLSEVEIDAMGEIGNISMGTAATTLYTLLGRKVDITTPRVSLTTMHDISAEYPLPFVAVEVEYTKGLKGTNILFLRDHDVKIITDLMMGGDGSNVQDELSELHLSAISEVMNQMVGSSSTSLSKLIGVAIDISPPNAFMVDLGKEALGRISNPDEVIVRTSFDMVVEGLIDSQIMQVTPVDFSRSMIESLMSGGATAAAGMTDATAPPPPAPLPPPPPPPPLAPAPA
ncbi:MAG: flagellar motor switch phosphatase FliY, partial [Oscillospiraceae bacterium]|nr:flagellar motor switch phosphatase FliY [Oscillospiraceae bacterium]